MLEEPGPDRENAESGSDGLANALHLLQARLVHVGLIARFAVLALRHVHHPADGNHGDDKEYGDEPHTLLQQERSGVAALPAAHRLRG